VVRRLRDFVVGWVRQLVTEALVAVRGLRSPRRLAMLLGGNLATEVLFALALGTFVRAFGASVGLGELLLIVIGVSLLAGLMPVPGGIGVTEGGLIYGLIAAGLSEEVAFASVITYRLATFYLPPVWGFFALRWLERNQHL
jgi:glycosyltransferase 2 family protein